MRKCGTLFGQISGIRRLTGSGICGMATGVSGSWCILIVKSTCGFGPVIVGTRIRRDAEESRRCGSGAGRWNASQTTR
ncbi:Hypothetical protein NTJ_14339 [Nesidiocoris tenuis]|uniref:Uncharacterized protein n=1 Tax=Nesidiocoris tenuis TaxID=355587 RepID=A0ABN7BCW3_9HEMI|nr:Hypothetical protein NTJ_14339 [Nesidiocoris tenuis]